MPPVRGGHHVLGLGEILKAHAGILESDPPGVALSKLDLVLPEGDERSWFRRRLLPLLGIEATSTADREELFTAWRRFIEHVAEAYPTVLVFEDLHWADEALLAFLEHVAERAEGVPLLMVGTARPDLLDHRPDYAIASATRPRSTSIRSRRMKRRVWSLRSSRPPRSRTSCGSRSLSVQAATHCMRKSSCAS